MKKCKIPSPTIAGRQHPILPVRYLTKHLTPAQRFEGSYILEVPDAIHDGLADGSISVNYQFLNGVLYSIILLDMDMWERRAAPQV